MLILLWVIPTLVVFGFLVLGTGVMMADEAPKPANEELKRYEERRAA